MPWFYDNKGLPHPTKSHCDYYNRSYLAEERSARSEQEKLLESQNRQAKKQRIAQEKIATIVQRDAEAAENQRQFTKDIQWLERSDAKGRVAYYFQRSSQEITTAIAELLVEDDAIGSVATDNSLLQNWRSKVALHNQQVKELHEVSSKLQKERLILREKRKELKCLKERIGAQETARKNLFLKRTLLRMQVSIYRFFGFSSAEARLHDWLIALEVRADSGVDLLPQLSGEVSARSITASTLDKRRRHLENELEKSVLDPRTSPDKACRSVFQEWASAERNKLAALIQVSLRNGVAYSALKSAILRFEQSLPNTLHVNWDVVSPKDVEEMLTSACNDVLRAAEKKSLTLEVFVTRGIPRSDLLLRRWMTEWMDEQRKAEAEWGSDQDFDDDTEDD